MTNRFLTAEQNGRDCGGLPRKVEDLEFATEQGTNYGNVCGLQFLESFAQPRSEEFIDGWFETLSNAVERDKQSIRDRGGSEDYVQAFVTAMRTTMDEYVSGFIFGRTIAENI